MSRSGLAAVLLSLCCGAIVASGDPAAAAGGGGDDAANSAAAGATTSKNTTREYLMVERAGKTTITMTVKGPTQRPDFDSLITLDLFGGIEWRVQTPADTADPSAAFTVTLETSNDCPHGLGATANPDVGSGIWRQSVGAWEWKRGWLSSGNDIAKQTFGSIVEAQGWCAEHADDERGCVGFTYQHRSRKPNEPVEYFFKDIENFNTGPGSDWSSYLRAGPQRCENGPPPQPDDPYVVLGVSSYAHIKAIKRAYRKKTLQYHPDKFVSRSDGDREVAKSKFREVSEAYERVGDPQQRAQLDQRREHERSHWFHSQAEGADFYDGNVAITAFTRSLYTSLVRNGTVWLVHWYNPRSAVDQRTKTAFSRTATKLRKLSRYSGKLFLGSVNCEKQTALCKKKKVTRGALFPGTEIDLLQLLIPKEKHKEPYKGRKMAGAIIGYVRSLVTSDFSFFYLLTLSPMLVPLSLLYLLSTSYIEQMMKPQGKLHQLTAETFAPEVEAAAGAAAASGSLVFWVVYFHFSDCAVCKGLPSRLRRLSHTIAVNTHAQDHPKADGELAARTHKVAMIDCDAHRAVCMNQIQTCTRDTQESPDPSKPHLFLWTHLPQGSGARIQLLDYNKHLQDPKNQQAHLDVAFDVVERMATSLLPNFKDA